MRLRLGAFSRHRPRALTVVVLVIIAALLVLANLSFDVRGANGERLKLQEIMRHGIRQLSYGWPLVWHRYTLAFWNGPSGVVGWHYHPGRLAASVAIWLAMLAAPAGVCEWLLHRYRPRLRWSLRTMLAVVALAAALCAWFVAARGRMNVQDELMATIRGRGGYVWIERRGPRWLGVVGADRFRQHVFAVQVKRSDGDDFEYAQDEGDDLQLLKRLVRLPNMQCLHLDDLAGFTPAMAGELCRFPQLRVLRIDLGCLPGDAGEALAALSEAKQLRTLQINVFDSSDACEPKSRECPAAIGRITQLERLDLSFPKIDDEHLDCLASLTSLKRLSLSGLASAHSDSHSKPPLFRRLPVLPQLETLRISDCEIDSRDLHCLENLPRLKSLALAVTMANSAEIAELTSLGSLEDLAIAGAGSDSLLSPEGIEALQSLKRLKTLRIPWYEPWSEVKSRLPGARLPSVPAEKEEGCFRAIEALQQSNPSMVIENYSEGMGGTWPGHWDLLPDYDTAEGIENSVQAMPWLPPTMKPTVTGEIDNLKW